MRYLILFGYIFLWKFFFFFTEANVRECTFVPDDIFTGNNGRKYCHFCRETLQNIDRLIMKRIIKDQQDRVDNVKSLNLNLS